MFAWTILALAVVGVSLALLVLWSSWRKNKRDEEFASFVWLRTKPEKMTTREVAKLVSGVANEPLTYLPTPAPGNVCQVPMEGSRLMFAVALSRAPLGVILTGESYFDDNAAAAADTKDLRIKRAILAHKAWSAVDAMDSHGNENALSTLETTRLLAGIAYEMADDDCLLLLVRPEGLAYPYSPETLAALKTSDPLKSLQARMYVPVIPVGHDDKEMEAAKAEAKRRFGEFESAFAKGDKACKFSIKAPFVTGSGDPEFIWISVASIASGVIHGTLSNDPLNLPGKKLGDPVDVPVDDVCDWIIYNEKLEEMTGGFTVKVLADR